ncbi:MAG: SDR family NAD(P)-dependent oxidoreductase [bacterium]|nr:SDR family NAD(P)-dependent oxidoreductase [bacterium]
MDISGKAAIITGGGTGVGRETALQLAKGGCSVLVNYSRSKDDAEKTAEDCRALGVKAIAHQASVADDSACRGMVKAATTEFGHLDILVQSAGTTVFVPHTDLDGVKAEDWQELMAVNVVGPFQMARAARGPLQESGDGEVVMISSVAGVAGQGSSIPYCASKAALNNLTVTLARVLAPQVRVNAVAPGAITGRWLQGGLGESYDGAMAAISARVPLAKVSSPEDIADAVLGIVTGSDLMTGQVLVVDGGMLITI